MTTVKATCGDCRNDVDLTPADIIVLHSSLLALWPHCDNVQATPIKPIHRLALAVAGCPAFDGGELEAVIR